MAIKETLVGFSGPGRGSFLKIVHVSPDSLCCFASAAWKVRAAGLRFVTLPEAPATKGKSNQDVAIFTAQGAKVTHCRHISSNSLSGDARPFPFVVASKAGWKISSIKISWEPL